MNDESFRIVFKGLTGNVPLRWQERLFQDYFVKNQFPHIIDLPTGLGKTMVMAIWLIAREVNKDLPRRLIYVVDRRTVVDQATDIAIQLQNSVGKSNLAISPLRGQLADNRFWSRDPSRPAIIIGTVDLIGSALLFSGYRSSYKRRPLEAGLLGQDSLLVLDEAHLSKPFEKLVKSIRQFQLGQGMPIQVIRMSATSGRSNDENVFTLDTNPESRTFDLRSDPEPVTGEERNLTLIRYNAPKRLTIAPAVDAKELNNALCQNAIELAKNDSIIGKRIVVFVRSPDDATKIAALIRSYEMKSDNTTGKKFKTTKSTPYAGSVEILTGTMRGLERDEFVEKQILKRFLDSNIDPANQANQEPAFLISTSAGEVGFDLNADHMVCDAAPLDSMIQRLGRVNRRGKGDAIVRLVLKQDPAEKTDVDKACIATSDLFDTNMDVSPKALAEFRSKLSSDQLKSASTPEPTMVELTDILLDAWSMTSITERMPGRPEVAPWLRGIAEDLPQTSIVWRAELDLPGFDQLDYEDLEEWFDTHSIHTHEVLSVPTSSAAKWFAERWAYFTDFQKRNVGPRPIVVDRAGLKVVTVVELIGQLERKNISSIRNADLIVPASFGGIERGAGLLDPSAPTKWDDDTDADEETRNANAAARRTAPDVADERGRYRELDTKNENGIPNIRQIGSGTKPAKPSRLVIELESDDETRVQLVSYVPKHEKAEWGSQRQTLRAHVDLVRKRLDDILYPLSLDEPIRRAARLAADYHDHGKNRDRWQRTVDGVATALGQPWTGQTVGKSGGTMKRDARNYRHEFGSLREFIDAHQGQTDPEVFDLAMHLIATHHGRGRPHFPQGGFDPGAESRSASIHSEVIRRFARLQRKYGWWRLAWLENLLRCADALASADLETDIDDFKRGGT